VPAMYESATVLSAALKRAAAAHGRHEEEIGEADPNWPEWYAQYMVQEQADATTPSIPGARP
jgi:hypothetical protein